VGDVVTDTARRAARSALADVKAVLDFHARNMTDAEWVELLLLLRDEVGDRQRVMLAAKCAGRGGET
jgi:hypothetical protein